MSEKSEIVTDKYVISEEQLKQIRNMIFHEDEVKFEKLLWKIVSSTLSAELREAYQNGYSIGRGDQRIEDVDNFSTELAKERARWFNQDELQSIFLHVDSCIERNGHMSEDDSKLLDKIEFLRGEIQ